MNDLPNRARLLQIIDELLTGWSHGDAFLTTRRQKRTKVSIAYGLAAHAHRLARVARDLLEAGLTLEAIPLVRTAFECALTAHWVVQMKEGDAALANEEVRSRRAFVRTLERASASVAPFAGQVADYPEVAQQTNASARNFQQVCDDLEPGGADAYAHYRLLSQMSHASVFVVDFYLQPHDGPAGLSLLVEPDQPAPVAYLGFLAASLVWAGRAVDYLDSSHTRRAALRQAARELNITPDLKPSDIAWLEGRT